MNGQEMYSRAKRLIPGGTQLFSKRSEQFLPGGWPAYYSSARGVEVVGLDGRAYVDMSTMGVGACVLGYADPEVDSAVKAAIDSGVQSTLSAPEEVELAEVLCELHPWADMVRYARAGGEAMAIAVRIARAATKRDKIAFCGYHGWMDWYLAANLIGPDALDAHLLAGLEPLGVPGQLVGTALPFHYNRIEQLQEIVASNKGEIAAIVMEPQRGQEPAAGFLEEVREIATGIGAVLVFDEITTGFRMTTGGIHLELEVEPDMAVFAKALANGYAMAAVIGRARIMEAAQYTFVSSTNWTERVGPSAALATIARHQHEKAAEHICRLGSMVKTGWEEAASRHGIPLEAYGLPSLPQFSIGHPRRQALYTLYTQQMLERGYLAWHQFKPSLAHTDTHVEDYLADSDEVFAELSEAIHDGSVASRLMGPPQQSGFYRLA